VSESYLRWFREIHYDDVPLVGGKNASLGEMYANLADAGVRVPNGFAITAQAYRDVIEYNALGPELRKILAGLDPSDAGRLQEAAGTCRHLIYNARLPDALVNTVLEAHGELRAQYGGNMTVAVRSSATAEDLPDASFAGQHDTFLNVAGGAALLDACRRCFASLYTDRAVVYRVNHGFDHAHVALSLCVMKMVRSDLASSGVIFTLDTESGFRDVVFVTASYGLGENVVQGAVDPDEFYVHKPTFRQGYRQVLKRSLGEKAMRMVYGERRGGATVFNQPTPYEDRERFCISDGDVLDLADLALRIESHYSTRNGRDTPMDIEWARDGIDGELYIVQARPETVASQRSPETLREYVLEGRGEELISGRAVGAQVASGQVRVIRSNEDLHRFQPGEVLVSNTTSPDWGPVMRKAAALVTNRGGRTCHAAIVARELDIPAVVGCDHATRALADGATVTVSCAEGEVGRIYAGQVPFSIRETDLGQIEKPKTKMMVNLGNPDIAFKTACLPADGVGLARLEFIINEYVKAHPMALAHPERLDANLREQIRRLTHEYDSPTSFFVARLAEGVGTIAAAFYPRPVIVRLSDFKTNEYANLLGGSEFEPVEANPMLGFRGASRYAHPAYEDGFALECAAMKRVREEMGLDNVKLMIPFCRRVAEAEQVIAAMARHGLVRGENGLEIYVMCEIPNNVIMIDEFAKHFDGFSIGSNDLTQLTLGVDRDSELVAFDFDERDPGVMKLLELAVKGAKRNGCYSGICGQAPSDYPEVAEFLVGLGIDSLSLNPDSLLATMQHVAEIEQARSSAKAK
jgi:pyruvate,water dikinase